MDKNTITHMKCRQIQRLVRANHRGHLSAGDIVQQKRLHSSDNRLLRFTSVSCHATIEHNQGARIHARVQVSVWAAFRLHLGCIWTPFGPHFGFCFGPDFAFCYLQISIQILAPFWHTNFEKKICPKRCQLDAFRCSWPTFGATLSASQ